MNYTKLFMLMMFIIGIIMLVLSFIISGKIDQSAGCIESKIKNSIRGVVMMSVAMITLAVSFLICQYRCNCDESASEGLIFVVLTFLMGIVFVVLGALIQSAAAKNSACSNIKKYAPGIWVIGSLFILCSGSFFGYKIYKVHQAGGLKGITDSIASKARSALSGGGEGFGGHYGYGF